MTCCCELKAITHITTKSISLRTGWGIKDQFEDGIIMDQPERIDYLRVYFGILKQGDNSRGKCEGVFLWSLMDLFSWTNGYNKRYGFVLC